MQSQPSENGTSTERQSRKANAQQMPQSQYLNQPNAHQYSHPSSYQPSHNFQHVYPSISQSGGDPHGPVVVPYVPHHGHMGGNIGDTHLQQGYQQQQNYLSIYQQQQQHHQQQQHNHRYGHNPGSYVHHYREVDDPMAATPVAIPAGTITTHISSQEERALGVDRHPFISPDHHNQLHHVHANHGDSQGGFLSPSGSSASMVTSIINMQLQANGGGTGGGNHHDGESMGNHLRPDNDKNTHETHPHNQTHAQANPQPNPPSQANGNAGPGRNPFLMSHNSFQPDIPSAVQMKLAQGGLGGEYLVSLVSLPSDDDKSYRGQSDQTRRQPPGGSHTHTDTHTDSDRFGSSMSSTSAHISESGVNHVNMILPPSVSSSSHGPDGAIPPPQMASISMHQARDTLSHQDSSLPIVSQFQPQPQQLHHHHHHHHHQGLVPQQLSQHPSIPRPPSTNLVRPNAASGSLHMRSMSMVDRHAGPSIGRAPFPRDEGRRLNDSRHHPSSVSTTHRYPVPHPHPHPHAGMPRPIDVDPSKPRPILPPLRPPSSQTSQVDNRSHGDRVITAHHPPVTHTHVPSVLARGGPRASTASRSSSSSSDRSIQSDGQSVSLSSLSQHRISRSLNSAPRMPHNNSVGGGGSGGGGGHSGKSAGPRQKSTSLNISQPTGQSTQRIQPPQPPPPPMAGHHQGGHRGALQPRFLPTDLDPAASPMCIKIPPPHHRRTNDGNEPPASHHHHSVGQVGDGCAVVPPPSVSASSFQAQNILELSHHRPGSHIQQPLSRMHGPQVTHQQQQRQMSGDTQHQPAQSHTTAEPPRGPAIHLHQHQHQHQHRHHQHPQLLSQNHHANIHLYYQQQHGHGEYNHAQTSSQANQAPLRTAFPQPTPQQQHSQTYDPRTNPSMYAPRGPPHHVVHDGNQAFPAHTFVREVSTTTTVNDRTVLVEDDSGGMTLLQQQPHPLQSNFIPDPRQPHANHPINAQIAPGVMPTDLLAAPLEQYPYHHQPHLSELATIQHHPHLLDYPHVYFDYDPENRAMDSSNVNMNMNHHNNNYYTATGHDQPLTASSSSSQVEQSQGMLYYDYHPSVYAARRDAFTGTVPRGTYNAGVGTGADYHDHHSQHSASHASYSSYYLSLHSSNAALSASRYTPSMSMSMSMSASMSASMSTSSYGYSTSMSSTGSVEVDCIPLPGPPLVDVGTMLLEYRDCVLRHAPPPLPHNAHQMYPGTSNHAVDMGVPGNQPVTAIATAAATARHMLPPSYPPSFQPPYPLSIILAIGGPKKNHIDLCTEGDMSLIESDISTSDVVLLFPDVIPTLGDLMRVYTHDKRMRGIYQRNTDIIDHPVDLPLSVFTSPQSYAILPGLDQFASDYVMDFLDTLLLDCQHDEVDVLSAFSSLVLVLHSYGLLTVGVLPQHMQFELLQLGQACRRMESALAELDDNTHDIDNDHDRDDDDDNGDVIDGLLSSPQPWINTPGLLDPHLSQRPPPLPLDDSRSTRSLPDQQTSDIHPSRLTLDEDHNMADFPLHHDHEARLTASFDDEHHCDDHNHPHPQLQSADAHQLDLYDILAQAIPVALHAPSAATVMHDSIMGDVGINITMTSAGAGGGADNHDNNSNSDDVDGDVDIDDEEEVNVNLDSLFWNVTNAQGKSSISASGIDIPVDDFTLNLTKIGDDDLTALFAAVPQLQCLDFHEMGHDDEALQSSLVNHLVSKQTTKAMQCHVVQTSQQAESQNLLLTTLRGLIQIFRRFTATDIRSMLANQAPSNLHTHGKSELTANMTTDAVDKDMSSPPPPSALENMLSCLGVESDDIADLMTMIAAMSAMDIADAFQRLSSLSSLLPIASDSTLAAGSTAPPLSSPRPMAVPMQESEFSQSKPRQKQGILCVAELSNPTRRFTPSNPHTSDSLPPFDYQTYHMAFLNDHAFQRMCREEVRYEKTLVSAELALAPNPIISAPCSPQSIIRDIRHPASHEGNPSGAGLHARHRYMLHPHHQPEPEPQQGMILAPSLISVQYTKTMSKAIVSSLDSLPQMLHEKLSRSRTSSPVKAVGISSSLVKPGFQRTPHPNGIHQDGNAVMGGLSPVDEEHPFVLGSPSTAQPNITEDERITPPTGDEDRSPRHSTTTIVYPCLPSVPYSQANSIRHDVTLSEDNSTDQIFLPPHFKDLAGVLDGLGSELMPHLSQEARLHVKSLYTPTTLGNIQAYAMQASGYTSTRAHTSHAEGSVAQGQPQDSVQHFFPAKGGFPIEPTLLAEILPSTTTYETLLKYPHLKHAMVLFYHHYSLHPSADIVCSAINKHIIYDATKLDGLRRALYQSKQGASPPPVPVSTSANRMQDGQCRDSMTHDYAYLKPYVRCLGDLSGLVTERDIDAFIEWEQFQDNAWHEASPLSAYIAPRLAQELQTADVIWEVTDDEVGRLAPTRDVEMADHHDDGNNHHNNFLNDNNPACRQMPTSIPQRHDLHTLFHQLMSIHSPDELWVPHKYRHLFRQSWNTRSAATRVNQGSVKQGHGEMSDHDHDHDPYTVCDSPDHLKGTPHDGTPIRPRTYPDGPRNTKPTLPPSCSDSRLQRDPHTVGGFADMELSQSMPAMVVRNPSNVSGTSWVLVSDADALPVNDTIGAVSLPMVPTGNGNRAYSAIPDIILPSDQITHHHHHHQNVAVPLPLHTPKPSMYRSMGEENDDNADDDDDDDDDDVFHYAQYSADAEHLARLSGNLSHPATRTTTAASYGLSSSGQHPSTPMHDHEGGDDDNMDEVSQDDDLFDPYRWYFENP